MPMGEQEREAIDVEEMTSPAQQVDAFVEAWLLKRETVGIGG